MGTITRSLANNVLTDGIISASGFNNDSFTNITVWPAGISAGNYVQISENEISSPVSSVSVTSGLTSTYNMYLIKFNGIQVATDGVNVTFNGSTDGGSNYNVAKTTTYTRAVHDESNTSTSWSYETDKDLANSTSAQRLSHVQSNDADATMCGFIWLFNPADTTYKKKFMADIQFSQQGPYSFNAQISGIFETASAINAFQIATTSGNLTAGKIKLYGLKDA